MVINMDSINQHIISELKKNARVQLGVLASIVGISRQALTKRIETLEKNGYIAGYTILTTHRTSDDTHKVYAFLRIRFKEGNDCFKLSKIFPTYKNILASWAITGNWDAVILLAADNMETISEIREIIAGTGGIDQIETEVILNWLHDRGVNKP